MQTISQQDSHLILELPKQEYLATHSLQLDILQAKRKGILTSDIFLLVEHFPVFTLGKSGEAKNILVSEHILEKNNISLVQIERGGDITYHGPGQLVLYPILDLRRARLKVPEFVWLLEEIMLKTAEEMGVSAQRDFCKRGVWAGEKKLGSVGIAIRRGISFHGLAFNVNTWLEPFSWINPCGMENVQATSLERESNDWIQISDISSKLKKNIQSVLNISLPAIDLCTLSEYMDLHGSELKAKSKKEVGAN